MIKRYVVMALLKSENVESGWVVFMPPSVHPSREAAEEMARLVRKQKTYGITDIVVVDCSRRKPK